MTPERSRGTAVALAVDDLTITGPVGALVRSLSLVARRGETVAIVGESGSGKSLTARAITGLLPAGVAATGTMRLGDGTADAVELAAMDERAWRAVRGSGIALLLQDPFTSLVPLRRVGAQIADTLRAHRDRADGRLGRRELRAMVAERLAEVRLPERVAAQFPHELSGGMRQRVAIAAALAADPAVLVADEPTTALDASTQDGILALIDRLKAERGMSVILISHDLELVRGHADTIEVLFGGSVVERGPAALVLADPVHPYTAGLLAASPSIERRAERLPTEPWLPSDPDRVPAGASFGDGYASAEHVRGIEPPHLVPIGDGRSVAVYADGRERPLTERRAAWTAADERADVAGREPAGAPALRVVDLEKRFGDHLVLDRVGFDVAVGEIVGIVGESGSGKTTIARCIVGLERPDAGRIEPTPTADGGRRGRRGGVQIVFQDPASALNPSHTVETALREVLRAVGDTDTAPAVLLERVGIPAALLRRRPRSLSGGQRQRVAIARALAAGPSVLVCDESVSALDVSVQAQILELLKHLRDAEALSIVFISHDLGVINQIADRVVVLHEGVIVEEGRPDDVLVAPTHAYTAHLVAAARRTGTRAQGRPASSAPDPAAPPPPPAPPAEESP